MELKTLLSYIELIWFENVNKIEENPTKSEPKFYNIQMWLKFIIQKSEIRLKPDWFSELPILVNSYMSFNRTKVICKRRDSLYLPPIVKLEVNKT